MFYLKNYNMLFQVIKKVPKFIINIWGFLDRLSFFLEFHCQIG